MSSYRFCRPDDIGYLVRAVNECWDVHFPEAEPMTVERYRDEMKFLDVWPSNCLVASTDGGPVAVLIGTKRATEVAVLRLGVHPDHRRRGHGAHLLTSLSHKLAVLGPERLVAEVPRSLSGVGEFFAAAGWAREAAYADWVRPHSPVDPVPQDLVMPITVDEVDDHGLLEIAEDVAWQRRRETLLNRKEEIEGAAIVSPERVEAFVLHRIADDASAVDVVASGARDGEQEELLLGLLLRHLAGETTLPLKIPRMLSGEFPQSVLAVWGFTAAESYDLMSVTATPS